MICGLHRLVAVHAESIRALELELDLAVLDEGLASSTLV
jgi:hypothetical protein